MTRGHYVVIWMWPRWNLNETLCLAINFQLVHSQTDDQQFCREDSIISSAWSFNATTSRLSLEHRRNTNHSFTTSLNHNSWEPIAFREANVWIRKNKAFMDIFGYSCDKFCLFWGYPCTTQAYPLGGLSTSQGISWYLTSLCISQLRYNHPILSQVPKGCFWNPRAPKPPSHTIWSSGCPPVSRLLIFIDDTLQ